MDVKYNKEILTLNDDWIKLDEISELAILKGNNDQWGTVEGVKEGSPYHDTFLTTVRGVIDIAKVTGIKVRIDSATRTEYRYF